ncbi:MAG: hypothetical protein LBJ23_04855, partial [Tannerella sp.]|nr:hypothetical protein [Tannerella sp.]
SDDLKADADIRRALDMCEEGAFTEAELAAYEKYWDIVRTEGALVAVSLAEGREKGREEGRAEGEAKGRAEGREEGRAEGEAKGRAEGREEGRAEGEAKGREESLIDVVLNCKRSGFSLEQIRAITGLDEKRILEILQD